MAFNYGSNAAFQALITKVETLLTTKVNTEDGKGLSTNDLTNELKSHYDAAYTHSQAAHAPSDAEKNALIQVSINGTNGVIDPESRVCALTLALPTKVSDLTNDSNFQTNTQVSQSITTALQNYYTKTETYTKTEVNAAIAAANHLKFAVVEQLPTQDISETTIYLVAKAEPDGQDGYTEYLYVDNQWEVLGDTDIDLSNYVTNDSLATTLADYVKTTDMVEITAEEIEAMFTA